MSQLTLEEAKAFLKKTAIGSNEGINLYDHLSEVLLKILVEKPMNSCEAFEQISAKVKQERYTATSSNNADQGNLADSKTRVKQEVWCSSALGLLKPPGEDEPQDPVTGVADVLDEANMFEWAGIGFSKGENFRLSVSIQKLAVSKQTTSMRLWGKFLGADVDFYIAEGLVAEAYEPEDPNEEEGADGANKFTYWAMKDDGNYIWEKLPHVSRKQILGARKIKRFVRSDLEGNVPGNPPFPGKEKNFLRAQIARISAATTICPAGFFTLSEEDSIEIPEELEPKSADELAELSGWMHFSKELNSVYGRATAMPPLQNEEGEETPWEGEVFVDQLRSLSEDAENSWRIEKLPATIQPSVGELAVVKSLNWPGAVSIGLGKKFLNTYVGYGLKFSKENFQMCLPEDLQKEFGVGINESTDPDDQNAGKLQFVNLQEQPDVVEDPTPNENEDEDEG